MKIVLALVIGGIGSLAGVVLRAAETFQRLVPSEARSIRGLWGAEVDDLLLDDGPETSLR